MTLPPNVNEPNSCVAELCRTIPELSMVSKKSVGVDARLPVNCNAGADAVPLPVAEMAEAVVLLVTVNAVPDVAAKMVTAPAAATAKRDMLLVINVIGVELVVPIVSGPV